MRRGWMLLALLPATLFAVEYDFCFKTTTVDSGDLGRIVTTKPSGSNWSAKETGTTTHRGEVFKVVTIDVSATDYASLTSNAKVYYVNDLDTPTNITTTAVSE